MKTGGILCAAIGVLLCVSCSKNHTGEAPVLYAKASLTYARGEFAEAADMLAGEKSFVPSLVLRGKALYFCGEDAGAEANLRRAFRLNPSSGEAALFLARLLRDRGQDRDANALTETLIRDNPQDIRALRLASDLASARNDGESAAAFLDRAVEASAETALVFIDRARLRWINGNAKGAFEDLSRAETLLPGNTSLSKSIGELRFLIVSSTKDTKNENSQMENIKEEK